MPNTRSIQFSFSGGEVSPDMYGRIDQKSFQTGLKKCKNAIVRPQGPVKRRPGLSYCAESSDSNTRSRLIQLQTNPQTVMEVKNNHVRFLRNSGLLLASDTNPNVPYGTVREYVQPMQVQLLGYVPPGAPVGTPSIPVWTSYNFGGTALTNHNFTDGDTIVFSWGTDPTWMPPLSPAIGAGFSYTNTLYSAASFEWATNSWFPNAADLALLPKFGACVVLDQSPNNSATPYGWPVCSPMYLSIGPANRGAFTRMATSSGNTLLPLRRGSYAINQTPVTTSIRVRAIFSHVGRPNTVTDYDSDTQIYYVKVIDAQRFQVSLTPNGPAVTPQAWNLQFDNLPGQGVATTLPHYVMRVYLAGDQIRHSNTNYYVRTSFYGQQQTFDPVGGPHASKLYNMGGAGDLRVPLPTTYSEQHLQELNYAISNDVATLAHAERVTVDIQRTSDRQWTTLTSINNPTSVVLGDKSFTAPRSVILRGNKWKATTLADSNATLQGPRNVPFVLGDFALKIVNPNSSDPYVSTVTRVVRGVNYTDQYTQRIGLTDINGVVLTLDNSDVSAEWEIVPSLEWETLASIYRVAAIDVNGVEYWVGVETLRYHNLSSRGAATWLVWASQANAVQYRVYKRANGVFGWVGDTNNTYWVDENYDADLAQRPVLYDYSYGTNNQYAQAVSYFEQRRVYGGSTLYPSRIWMTRSNTLYDFGYSIPVKDTDRIVVEMAARQTERIRHLVPLGDLMVMTDQGEWQLSPVNSDVITPTTISVRKQSNFGANYTVPVTIGQTAVYVTARGGHVRELGYSNDQRGYVTGDLSLRAAHLFDGKDLIDLDCIKSPFPVLWFVSTDGKLKALTYIPDEKIYAWHEHDTDGVFESAAAITEGVNDVLYVVVRRTINGQTKRYIERLAPLQEFGDTDVYLDSSLSGDGTNTTATTMRLSQVGQQGWTVGSTVTVTRSTGAFVSTDVGDYLVVYDATGSEYRVEILSVGTPTTTALARIVDDIPLAVQDVATASWAFARNQWSGLSHLEGKTVSIWADGVMQASKVVSGGSVTIDTPAIKVRIGLPYTTTVETLPIALQADAFGQGRTKNVNKVWVRMQGTQEFQIGPTTSDLVSSGTLPSGQTDGELQVTLLPAWSQDGSIVMQQSDAFPMNINGLTLEAAIGS